MTCRLYVIYSTERDWKSRWSVACLSAYACVGAKGHHFEHLL